MYLETEIFLASLEHAGLHIFHLNSIDDLQHHFPVATVHLM